MGVFATRSPFRPNPVGLSCVRLDRIVYEEKLGPVIYVSGIDMLDGTPVYDIKPYLSYCDSHADAKCGFADEVKSHALSVVYEPETEKAVGPECMQTICDILAQDPRTAYMDDEERKWGLTYREYNIKFSVRGEELRILEISKVGNENGNND